MDGLDANSRFGKTLKANKKLQQYFWAVQQKFQGRIFFQRNERLPKALEYFLPLMYKHWWILTSSKSTNGNEKQCNCKLINYHKDLRPNFMHKSLNVQNSIYLLN